jgi:hypothetical protein
MSGCCWSSEGVLCNVVTWWDNEDMLVGMGLMGERVGHFLGCGIICYVGLIRIHD